MTEPDDALSNEALSLDLVTAALRADSTDVAIYARVLAQSLGEALPADCVSVERDRSMSDRMRGRPGEITKVAAQLGELQIAQWAASLAGALVSYVEQCARES